MLVTAGQIQGDLIGGGSIEHTDLPWWRANDFNVDLFITIGCYEAVLLDCLALVVSSTCALILSSLKQASRKLAARHVRWFR